MSDSPDQAVESSPRMAAEIETPMGYKLLRQERLYVAKVAELPLFHGMTSMTLALTDKIASAAQLDRVDVSVEKKVKRGENPELFDLGIENVKVIGDYDVLRKVLAEEAQLFHHLRKVLGTIQLEPWRNLLCPPDESAASKALVCPFTLPWEDGEYYYRYLVERVPSSKRNKKFFIRITIESPLERHLDLGSIPHVDVKDLAQRTVISQATEISEMLRDHVRWQIVQKRCSYTEENREESHVFSQLNDAGLSRLSMINIHWTDEIASNPPEVEASRLDRMFKKILLLLEDHLIRELLQQGNTIQVEDAELSVFLDLSQRGRVINISFQEMRELRDLSYYLHRMPCLERSVNQHRETLPFQGSRVLLVHHITPEVLGFIEALRVLGAVDVWTLFVRYGAEIPHDYLDVMLALDQERHRAHVLRNVESPDSVEGYYVMSSMFSDIDDAALLQERMWAEKEGYFEAMTRAGVWMFLHQAEACLGDGKPLVIIEDGGYLGPFLNRRAKEGALVCELFDICDMAYQGTELEPWGDQPLSRLLKELLIGTVEHTRNGHDRLREVVDRYGELEVPNYTIAMSHLKRKQEAADVATSILTATEVILNSQGWMLQRRKPVVIGAAGAIGGHLVEQLQHRQDPNRQRPVYCVDIRPPSGEGEGGQVFYERFEDIPFRDRACIDLFFGITGKSVLEGSALEEILGGGGSKDLFLVSGSTKSVEFQKVSEWVDLFLRGEKNQIGTARAAVRSELIQDPLTGKRLGTEYRFLIMEPDGMARKHREKSIFFLADLTPVNFTFYGVPREGIDEVLTQLLNLSVALRTQGGAEMFLEPRIYRLDWELDDKGNLLP